MALNNGFVLKSGVTPLDVRTMDGALITKGLDGAPRTGILFNPQVSGSHLFSRSNMTVAIVDGLVMITQRASGDGVVRLVNVGVATVALDPAPSANSRIDAIYVKQNDSTVGDATDAPVFDKVTGQAAASPTAPAIPSGAMLLGLVQIPAGVTATNASGVTITSTTRFTSVLGSPIRFRATSSMTNEASTLPEGTFGYVQFGATASNMSVINGGTWRAMQVPQVAGTFTTTGSIPANGSGGTTVTFPAGLFNAPPAVFATPNNGSIVISVDNPGTSSAVVTMSNRTATTVPAGLVVRWFAVALG